MEGSNSRRQILTRTSYSQQRVNARAFAKRSKKATPQRCPTSSPKEATTDGQPASKTTPARRKTAPDPKPVGSLANRAARSHGPRRQHALRQNLRIRTRQTRTEPDDAPRLRTYRTGPSRRYRRRRIRTSTQTAR